MMSYFISIIAINYHQKLSKCFLEVNKQLKRIDCAKHIQQTLKKKNLKDDVCHNLRSLFKQHSLAVSWSNHNYNKIVKCDWLSTALISALIGQFNRTVRVMAK